jgi:hypothetical protein
MSFPRLKSFAVLALLLALGSCKINTINSFPTNPSTVRYGAFMPNAPMVNVQVQGVTAWTDVPFQSITDYQQFNNQQTNFTVFLTTDPVNSVAAGSVSLSGQTAYTLVGFGIIQQSSLLFQDDTVPSTGSGDTQLRAANLAFGYGVQSALDVYITAPGVDITTISPTYTLAYGGATSFQTMLAGDYEVRVAPFSQFNLLYDSGTVNFPVNAAQGLYLYGVTSTHALNVLQSNVSGGTTMPLPNLLAALKVVNAAYQRADVDLKDNGVVQVGNLATNTATVTYIPVTAGLSILSFNDTLVPNTTIATITTTLNPSTDSSVMISGAAGSEVATVLSDVNTPPSTDVARIRAINASPDAPAFDVAVDGTVVPTATNVQYTQSSGYFDVASGNHTITFLATGTSTVIFTITQQAFGGSGVFSIYLNGPASALVDLLTQDNV